MARRGGMYKANKRQKELKRKKKKEEKMLRRQKHVSRETEDSGPEETQQESPTMTDPSEGSSDNA